MEDGAALTGRRLARLFLVMSPFPLCFRDVFRGDADDKLCHKMHGLWKERVKACMICDGNASDICRSGLVATTRKLGHSETFFIRQTIAGSEKGKADARNVLLFVRQTGDLNAPDLVGCGSAHLTRESRLGAISGDWREEAG